MQTHPQAATVFSTGLSIAAIETFIVDCPTTRAHRLSNTSIAKQSYVIVRVNLSDGSEGWGECATLGGPRWAEESVEAIKVNIDTYLTPSIIGSDALAFEANAISMRHAASRNSAARGGVESAIIDAAGIALGLPAYALLGGKVRDEIEVLWTLASGDADQEIDEAKDKLAARAHRRFKIKLGFHSPKEDVIRLAKIVEALRDSEIVVDINQGWSEATAIRYLPVLAEMGVVLIEQPLKPGMLAATARVAARSAVPIMIDEAAFTSPEIVQNGVVAAGSVYSLKLVKSGGLFALKRAAGVANAFGMELYGGCLLESGIGAAAHLAVFATLPELEWGCEHFGPRILVDDLLSSGLEFADFKVKVPHGPGMGVEVNRDLLRELSRK